MTFLEGLLWFVLGGLVATYFWRWLMREALDQIVERLEQQVQERSDKVIRMKIELVENRVYCYNAENNEFVCQGSNLDEVMNNFKARFPHYTGVISPDDNDSQGQEWIRINRAKMKEAGIE